MILVDIYVPSFDKEYDFHLDEKTPISILLEEITEMISQKEQCDMKGNLSELMLCSYESREILTNTKTLKECNVITGSRLLLL
ncbi:EsaB/YukD family protein [Anaeromicropila herbilytica]|uniref:Ubiquitin-like domain-containing protein n=1 Tax=Anaeromicropila herbilytica TaxID=2785025 RepID=A0A7R7EJN8_9FIRM|nr:EsaB/YukD family protein [Anaeromicropila herbilytica]BCN29969.1 hypothetical protein bsdtb5_12640 [Anaeromicropila herbilytica]